MTRIRPVYGQVTRHGGANSCIFNLTLMAAQNINDCVCVCVCVTHQLVEICLFLFPHPRRL